MNALTLAKSIGSRAERLFIHKRLHTDSNATYRARILMYVTLAVLLEHVLIFAAMMLSPSLEYSRSVTVPINLGSIASTSLCLYVLKRYGNIGISGFILVGEALAGICFAIFVTGGPYYSPSGQSLVLPFMMAFFFGGVAWGAVTLALTCSALIVMVAAQVSGFTFPQLADPAMLPFAQMLSLPVNFTIISALAFAYEFSSLSLQRERDEEHRRFIELARTDPLTGLANRRIFDETLQARIELYERLQPQRSFTLCYLDLDRFKPINDEFGHDIGDEVLGTVSRRLLSALRGADFIGRHGGDEFLILFDGVHTIDAINALGKRVLERVREPILTQAGVLQIDASLGFAAYPLHGRDMASLQKAADAAMYDAKRAQSGFHIHQPVTQIS